MNGAVAPGHASAAGSSPGAAPPAERIRFDHVSVQFSTASGPLTVVDDVSFGIANGEFVSIIGPSGCGKTTLMNLVAGFLRPARGF